jgi:hypothetical protein
MAAGFRANRSERTAGLWLNPPLVSLINPPIKARHAAVYDLPSSVFNAGSGGAPWRNFGGRHAARAIFPNSALFCPMLSNGPERADCCENRP